MKLYKFEINLTLLVFQVYVSNVETFEQHYAVAD